MLNSTLKFSVLDSCVSRECPNINFAGGYKSGYRVVIGYSTETGPEIGHFGHLVLYLILKYILEE